MLETSIGAISRVKTFHDHTKPENLPEETHEPPESWPEKGEIEFRNVSAAYKYVQASFPSFQMLMWVRQQSK